MRIAMKTLSYSVIHMAVAFTVAYGLSGNWKIALGISLIEPAVQSVAYFVHEHLWEKTPKPAHSRLMS